MRTDNITNTTLAKFDSIYDNAYIQFSNINNNIYLSGIANNTFKIYNPNINNDEGLIYYNNQLSVKSQNTQIIKYNNEYSVFPNDFTYINYYQFSEYNPNNINSFINCFDGNPNTYWESDAIYSLTDVGAINLANINFSDPFNFNNTGTRGYWVKIKFPYQIIPIGIFFSNFGTVNTPIYFEIFGSNDNITWTKLLYIGTSSIGNSFFFKDNTTLYLYVAIVITRIMPDTSATASLLQKFKINEIKIYTMPILHIDNNIKISNNNILNINTISTNRLIINNSLLSSPEDLTNLIISKTMQTIVDIYNIYWKNLGTTGYLNSNIVNKIAINKNIANSTLDIYGDIHFKQRSLNNYLTITNKGQIFNITSSYVYIGKIKFTNNINNYFKLSLILFELDKYYFQTIDINGYISFSSNFNIYWDTIYDNTYINQRIIDINYTIDYSYNDKTYILLYCKYNPILNITNPVAISDLTSDYINNIIYIDFINTSSMSNVEFLIKNTDNTINNLDTNIYSNAYLISSKTISKNINIVNNINTNNIKLNNSINSSNFLILDANKNISDSGISSNSLSYISKLPIIANKVIGTNNDGNIAYIDISSLLLSNINYCVNTNDKILISSNNLFQTFSINKNNFSNLNHINNTSNSILIIDKNNNLTTTNTLTISNISNILDIFNFNSINKYGKNYIFCNSNLSFNNINIGNYHIISSNYKYNKLLINDSEIADDIFKLIIRIPEYNNFIINKIEDPFDYNMPQTEPITFTVQFNNGSNIILSIHVSDNDNATNKKIYNIFDKSLLSYWVSAENFLNYNNTSYATDKYLYNDINGITKCGAYIIFDFGYEFILNFYVIYVNYPNIINSIRDFKLYGFNKITQTWILIDQQNNIFMNNNLIPNTFVLEKKNFINYSKYALCIINTYNTNNIIPSCVYINCIEFFGNPLSSNFLHYPNLISYNNQNNIVLMGLNNIGIKNIDPYCPLSIGNDIPSNPRNSMININHSTIINDNEIPIMTLTRPSCNVDIKGIKAIHYLNSIYNSNTNYTIKLSHENITNEQVIFSMNSSGNIGIGGYPDINLINNNSLSFYNKNSKFINIFASNINSNYSIVLPPSKGSNDMSLYVNEIINDQVYMTFEDPFIKLRSKSIVNFNSIGLISNNSSVNIIPTNNTSNYSIYLPPLSGSSNMTLIIDNIIDNSNLYFKFANPISNLLETTYIKIGNSNITTRNDNEMTVQIAGKCLIGSNDIEITNLNNNYFSNTLIVCGSIYATKDIYNDSDISYKYNIKIIEDPLEKINKINGYTFNRNDADDNNRYSGLIAQEVIKVMPEVITIKPDGKFRIIYTNLAGLFVEAIKKIDKKVDYINFKVNCLIGSLIGITGLYLYSKKR